MYRFLVLANVVSLPYALADRAWTKSDVCGLACQESLSGVVWSASPTATYYQTACQNDLATRSLFVCTKLRCNGQISPYWNESCIEYGGGLVMPPYSIINDMTDADISAIPTVTMDGLLNLSTVNSLLLPANDLFTIAYRTIDTWRFQTAVDYDYSYTMYGFWAGVILIGFLYRLMGVMTTSKLATDNEKVTSGELVSRRTSLSTQVKQYIILPATFGYSCASRVLGGTIPSRLQSLTILTYLCLNVVLCAVSYRPFAGNMYWPAVDYQVLRYFADRTGYLAFANLPLIWLFGSGNNVLMAVTGWDFASFNVFHRYVSRIAVIEAVLHSFAYTALALKDSKAEYIANFAQRYWVTGVAATITMSLILPLSLTQLRHHHYELFLYSHIALALATLVLLWYHVFIFGGQYNGFIWAAVACWSLDRFLRVGRLVWSNTGFSGRKTLATYDEKADLIRLDLCDEALPRAQPGAYYFVYLLEGLRLYESHPFTSIYRGPTVAKTIAHGPGWVEEYQSDDMSDLTNTKKTANISSSPAILDNTSVTSPAVANMSFIVRPHRGFTSRLRDRIVRKQLSN